VDGDVVGEAGEVGVSGDEDGGGGLGEGDEVVVVGVGGVDVGWGGRVGMLVGLAAEQVEQGAGLGRGDAGGDLGVGQDAAEFGEQGGGDEEFVVAVEPGAQELGGGPGPGQDRGDQDVGVQDGPQVPAGSGGSVQCWDCRVARWASRARATAASSSRSLVAQSWSSRSSPRSRRRASSMTWLSGLPVRAARTRTAVRTWSSRVTVVRVRAIPASSHRGALVGGCQRRGGPGTGLGRSGVGEVGGRPHPGRGASSTGRSRPTCRSRWWRLGRVDLAADRDRLGAFPKDPMVGVAESGRWVGRVAGRGDWSGCDDRSDLGGVCPHLD